MIVVWGEPSTCLGEWVVDVDRGEGDLIKGGDVFCWEALRREGHSRLVIERLLQGPRTLEAQGKSPLRARHVVKERALMNVVDRKLMKPESHLYLSSLP